jgi:hypothetical protein
MSAGTPRTTVSVTEATKNRMDKWRAPGQCYDGFLIQLVSLWEKTHSPDYIKEMQDKSIKPASRSKSDF